MDADSLEPFGGADDGPVVLPDRVHVVPIAGIVDGKMAPQPFVRLIVSGRVVVDAEVTDDRHDVSILLPARQAVELSGNVVRRAGEARKRTRGTAN